MTGWDDPVVIATIVGAVAGGASGGAVSILYDMRKDRLVIELERFEEKLSPPRSPCETMYSIRVKSNKTLEHCKVFVGDNSMPIPAAKGGSIPLETKISAGGDGVFRIPTKINPYGDDDGQLIIVKNNDKTVRKQGFRKIPLDSTQSITQADLADQPRVRELIKKVLTPLIENLEWNNQQRMRHYLEEEVLLYERIPWGGDATRLAFDSFKTNYPELGAKIKAYDEQDIDLRILRSKFEKVLQSRVQELVPSLLKESSSIPQEWNVGKDRGPGVYPEQIVKLGIFKALEGKPIEVKDIQGFLWSEKSKEFMALTEELDAKHLIDQMKKLAQKCFEDGVALKQELSQLRDNLGSRYKLTMEDYFVGNPFG